MTSLRILLGTPFFPYPPDWGFGRRVYEIARHLSTRHSVTILTYAGEEDERGAQTESPYQVQRDLQDMMQDLVGIVRREDEMVRALDGIGKLWERAKKVGITGNREYNPGWHTSLDLKNLLTVSEAVTRSAIERKESRGAQFRDDYPRKDDTQWGKVNIVTWKGADGGMQLKREPIPPMPEHLRQVIEENR